MFKKIAALFKKPAPVNPQITDAVTQAPYKIEPPSQQAELLKAAVTEKIAAKSDTAPNKKPRKPRAKKV